MSKISKVKQDKLNKVRFSGVPEKHGKELLTYKTRHPKYNNADVTDARTITQKAVLKNSINFTKKRKQKTKK